MNSKKNKKEHELANKMIQMLLDYGYSYNQMLPVFALAKEKYKLLQNCEHHNTEERYSTEIGFYFKCQDCGKKNPAPIKKGQKVSRNALCPCGSTQKYKKCCLTK